MNYKMIGKIISQILSLEAVFMLPALIISVFDKTNDVTFSFILTILIILAIAISLRFLCRRGEKGFYTKEGFFCVGISWIIMSLLGCLPFVFSKAIPNFIDALFEIVSGFTTTGATILTEIETIPRGLLYWRSFSHWLGGMGVLVFLLAIAPSSGRSSGAFSLHLLRAESPGPNVGKLVPRLKQTALILYIIYIALTLLNVTFLLIGGMPVFDSFCTAFGTAGTGGFGIKNDSMASYSPYLQSVCTVFMILFGLNFNCYYLLLLKEVKSFFKSEEMRFYFGIIAVCTVLITLDLRSLFSSFAETFHHASFQVASIITTTGFSTEDFNLWPNLSKSILVMLMIIGACAGSTGGGLKCARVLILFKSIKRNIAKLINPQKVQPLRDGDSVIDEKIIENTNIYFSAYMLIIAISFILVSFDGFSLTTNITAVLSCFNNIGPGLELVGPMGNFSIFNPFSKIILIIDMLAGRLEIFPILILFSRIYGKKV